MKYKPEFVIIGAMKCGTTTLYRDLYQHPCIFLPEEKEPETLVRNGGNPDKIYADYRSLFRDALPHQVVGEASTAYTKMPDYGGVAETARAVIGDGLKVIYITRDPVSRIISHYAHDESYGLVDAGIDETVVKVAKYMNYSMYDLQLESWLKSFNADNIYRLQFEEYVQDRRGTVESVCRFIGVDPAQLPALDSERVFNPGAGRPTPRGMWRGFVESRVYQRAIKPRVNRRVRELIASKTLPKSNSVRHVLAPHTIQTIVDRLNNATGFIV